MKKWLNWRKKCGVLLAFRGERKIRGEERCGEIATKDRMRETDAKL